MTDHEARKRATIQAAFVDLAQTVIDRCISSQSAPDGKLKPRYLYGVLSLLKSLTDNACAVGTLLANNHVVESAIIARVCNEAFVDFHFIMENKDIRRVWRLFFGDYVNELDNLGYQHATAREVPIEKVWKSVYIYGEAHKYKQRHKRSSLFHKPQSEHERLSESLQGYEKQIQSLATGNTAALDKKEIELARLHARIQLAKRTDKKNFVRTWRDISMDEKEKAIYTADVAQKMAALRYRWNLQTHSAAAETMQYMTRPADGRIRLPIGQEAAADFGRPTWSFMARYVATACRTMSEKFNIGPDINERIAALLKSLDDLKTEFPESPEDY